MIRLGECIGVAFYLSSRSSFLLEFQFGVNLLTGTGLKVCLLMQSFGGKLRPLTVSKLTLVYTLDQCRFSYRYWSETRTRPRNSFLNLSVLDALGGSPPGTPWRKHPPPPRRHPHPCEQKRCKNITLPQTSFAGGKYLKVKWVHCALVYVYVYMFMKNESRKAQLVSCRILHFIIHLH